MTEHNEDNTKFEEAQVPVSAPLPDGECEYTSFEHMNLHPTLLRGIYGYGFERPSTIQQRAIVPIAKGLDTLAQAQSGTGKTATFAIGLLQRINVAIKKPQGLILAPTRELAEQIKEVVATIGEIQGVVCKSCIGGTNVRADIAAIESGTHIIVGTPGRILDLINRRAFQPHNVGTFILDEADEMLSRGFKEQIYEIFQTLNHDTIQVCLISATVPPDVLEVSARFMRDPVIILVKNDELTLEGIRQFFIPVASEGDKFGALVDLYEAVQVAQSVIFCNSIVRVENLAKRLAEQNFAISCIHGEMPQCERTNIVADFRAGKSRVLISTDLLARGIDVQQVSVVINYDLPPVPENYLHRIGRGGRFGRKGVAINFIDASEKAVLDEISKHYDTHILQAPEDLAKIVVSG